MTERQDGLITAPDWMKYSIRQPKRVEWTPQPDITTYELAQCLPLLILGHNPNTYCYVEDNIPKGCERHFKVTDHG